MIFLNNVRLAFPRIKEPSEDGKYTAAFLMPASHPSYQEFMKKVGELALDKWKDKTSSVMGIINSDGKKRCYAEGNTKISQKTFKVYDGYADNMVINAVNKHKPVIYDANGNKVDPTGIQHAQEINKFYSGCHVNVVVKPWLQDNTHGVGVRCELMAIQFLKDGDKLGGGDNEVEVSGMFAAVPQTAPTLPPFMVG